MAKKVYIGVADKARKVKKIYIGVGNVARKVKKAYIGVGGVARPFWSGGEVAYYGTIPTGEGGAYLQGSASTGTHAIFAKGVYHTSSSYSSISGVHAFNSALTDSNITSSGQNCKRVAGAIAGTNAIFAGGQNVTSSSTYYSYAYSFDESLTYKAASSLSSSRAPASSTLNKNAVFGGGSGNGSKSDTDRYNTSLTRSALTSLDVARRSAAANAGNYILFVGGGTTTSSKSAVDVYNTSFTHSSLTLPSSIGANYPAASVGGYALFAGESTTVYVYNSSLTQSTTTTSQIRLRGFGVSSSSGEVCLIGGGSQRDTTKSSLTVDSYDTSLVRKAVQELDVDRGECATANVGEYMLISGGYSYRGSGTTNVDGNGNVKVIEVYAA